MEIIDTIKEMDPEQLRKYVVIVLMIGVVIVFRDMFIGIINIFLGLGGIAPIGTGGDLPPGVWLFIFGIGLFTFALFFTMFVQKKKLSRRTNPSDTIPRGYCDICNNQKAKNILPMKYKEGDKTSTIYICEKCRDDIKEMEYDSRNKS